MKVRRLPDGVFIRHGPRLLMIQYMSDTEPPHKNIWVLVCQIQVWRTGTSNYITHMVWNVITCPCPWYPLLAHKSSHCDDVIKWKGFPRYWPFVRGIHRWPVNSPPKGHRAHCDVTAMRIFCLALILNLSRHITQTIDQHSYGCVRL